MGELAKGIYVERFTTVFDGFNLERITSTTLGIEVRELLRLVRTMPADARQQ